MHIHVEHKDQIARLVLDREEALNALNKEMLIALEQVLDRLAQAPPRTLIVKTSGCKAFVAGADISEMALLTEAEGLAFGKLGNRVFSKLASFPCPVIAQLTGYVLGGGFELALACDMRLADEKVRLAFPETGLGITPGFGGTQRLSRLVGPSLAAELIFTGRQVLAEEALAKGLVHQVLPTEALEGVTEALAATIALRSPIAIRQAKKALYGGLDLPLEAGLALESTCFASCFASQDQKRAMAAFLEKKAFHDFKDC